MKTLDSLQLKLHHALKKHPDLRVYPEYPWSDPRLFNEVVWIVQDYITRNNEVITDTDELVDWLDEYRFFQQSRKNA